MSSSNSLQNFLLLNTILHTNTNIFEGLLEEQRHFPCLHCWKRGTWTNVRKTEKMPFHIFSNPSFYQSNVDSVQHDHMNFLSSGVARVSRRETQWIHLGSLWNFWFSTTKAYLVFVSTLSLFNINWCKEKPDWSVFKTAE